MRRSFRCIRHVAAKFVVAMVAGGFLLLVWFSPSPDGDVIKSTRSAGFARLDTAMSSSRHSNDIFVLRRQNVAQQCNTSVNKPWSQKQLEHFIFKDNPIISSQHQLLYCPVGKVASSFITRLILTMNTSSPVSSPYDIPIEMARRQLCESLQSLGSKENILSFMKNSTNIVFGRNPYSRIFSAFIDKLFSPNPFYWAYWGAKTLKVNRIRTTNRSCASDVTFRQFLRLVLIELHKTDIHLRPVALHCHMCHITYDVIGKLETVTEDVDRILAMFNMSAAFQNEQSYSRAAKMDIVYDSVKSAFGWKKDIAKYISLDFMGLRLWRKLQIRGVIDSSIPYPFRVGQLENMTAETFIAASREAMLRSTNESQLRKQKSQALAEAYRTVDLQDLMHVRRVYSADMNMFGYDPQPPELFRDRENVRVTGSMSWRTEWKL